MLNLNSIVCPASVRTEVIEWNTGLIWAACVYLTLRGGHVTFRSIQWQDKDQTVINKSISLSRRAELEDKQQGQNRRKKASVFY